MATSNKDFRIKNGLIVDGASATVNGNNVLTSASSINDLNDVVITDPSNGQVIKWNGSAWVNDTDATGEGGSGNSFTTIDVPNGSDPVADSATDTLTFSDGANITITGDSSTDTVTVAVDADLTGITSILTPNYIGLDLTPTGVPGTQGTLAWNLDQETIDIQLDTNVTLPVGQKHVIRVKNSSGSVAIPKGRVVMFAGAAGDTVTVTPAISTATYDPYLLVGVTAEEIPADGFGFVTQYGFVTGLDTDSFTLGNLLYVDPASPGVLTSSAPAAPNWTFPVAAVTRVQSASGIILVRAIPGGHLHDVVDVAISSPADNEVLAYNNESGVWINQTASEAGLVAEGDARLTDARTPTAHAASHGSAGGDAITIAQSQVTNLTTDLGAKANLASPTFTGTVTVPNGSSLGTPTTLTLTNATGLPVSGITSSTSAALGVGSIELGHATDTTVARSSAGVISVEGVIVPTISSANTLTNKTIDGANNTLTVRVANDISGLGTGVATFLGTPSSANLAAAVTDETGSGALVFATSPTLVTPSIGVATGTSFNSITGLSSTTPLVDGTAAVGTGTTTARADHVHPTDTSRAPLASPTFTGTVTTSDGITNAQQKNALIASGFDSTAGTPFAQASRVIMTAAGLTSTDPTTRPDGSALVVGDVWIDFQ